MAAGEIGTLLVFLGVCHHDLTDARESGESACVDRADPPDADHTDPQRLNGS